MNNKALVGFAISAVAVVAGLYLYDYIKESKDTGDGSGMESFRGRRR